METVRAFFQDLRARGLGDPLLVVSDGAPGIIRAIEECFPRSARQRCLAGLLKKSGGPDSMGVALILWDRRDARVQGTRSARVVYLRLAAAALVPDDHVLARVDRVLDLTWLRAEVAECYCHEEGRPGIDPEVAVRLMLAGLLIGIVHDRNLMREVVVNIAIRWFVGYGLHEKLPHHSSLTRIRQRWGEERFRRIFQRTVEACLKAKIATAEVVHIDASLIRANVSGESLVERHTTEVLVENETEDEIEVEKKARQSGKYKKVSLERNPISLHRSRRQ